MARRQHAQDAKCCFASCAARAVEPCRLNRSNGPACGPSGARATSCAGLRAAARVAGRHVGGDVGALAHAGDDGAHGRVVEDEAQGHFGHGHAVGHERLKRVGAFDAGDQVLRHEVDVAPVAFGPLALFGERAGERAFVEGHARDNGHVHLGAGRKQLVLRVLIEDVVDDLHGIDQTTTHGLDAVLRLPAIETEADSLKQSLPAQLVELLIPAVVREPAIVPRVQLHEIEAIEARVLQTCMDELLDVIGRVSVVHCELRAGGPLRVLGWDFGRGVESPLRVGAHQLT